MGSKGSTTGFFRRPGALAGRTAYKIGLRGGGILLAYIPTVLQVKTYVDALKEASGYLEIETFELIRRP